MLLLSMLVEMFDGPAGVPGLTRGTIAQRLVVQHRTGREPSDPLTLQLLRHVGEQYNP